MSEPGEPKPAKLVCGLLIGPAARIDQVIERLVGLFGPIDFLSEERPFDRSAYYEAEMGAPLLRRFASFQRLSDQAALVQVKLRTNSVEAEFSNGGKRTVNIDPGLLTEGNLILATGKASAHRPYLGQGLYADLTLLYQDGEYRPLAWTYPDYRDDWARGLMAKFRDKYLRDRRGR